MLESLFNIVAGPQACNLPVKFAKFFKNPYFEEHLRTTAFILYETYIFFWDIVMWSEKIWSHFLYFVGTENQVLELQSQQTNACFKVNNRNTRKRCENMFKVNKEDSRKTSLTSFWCFIVKACVRYFYQISVFAPNDSPSKTMKSVFYFIKKALFVLEIFKILEFFPFLSALSRYKRTSGSGIICDVMNWLT